MRTKRALAAVAATVSVIAATGAVAPEAMATGQRSSGQQLNAQDRTYLQESAQGDLFEIAGGGLALAKARSMAVHELAHRMIHDHAMDYVDAARTAKAVGTAVPRLPSMEQIHVLMQWRNLSGQRFECVFLPYQRTNHQHAIAAARTEIRTGRNAAVVSHARRSLPVLQAHLAMVTKILQGMSGCRPMTMRH